MANFGLLFFESMIKAKIITEKKLEGDEETRESFDVLVPLLVKCLGLPDNKLVAKALSITQWIINWPLGSLQRGSKKMVAATVGILQRLTALDREMISNSFKVISGLIVNNKYPFKPAQVKAVLRLIDEFFDLTESVQQPLTTLLVVIERYSKLAEVYDLVERVKEKLLKSESRSYKKHLRGIFLSFLVNYPISEKLFERHYYFLLQNLGYP